jgi:hypothetical protein
MRERIALEAARIMAGEGIRDYALAKRKAALRLGAEDTQHMPSNVEVEQALVDYQRLFMGNSQPLALRRRRELALKAMKFFGEFQPRLVGAVLTGTAGEHSDINLHVFCDMPETVVLFLMERNIPFEQGSKRVRVSRDQVQAYPVYRFLADDIGIEVMVFPTAGIRQAPLSPIDGKPMRRAPPEAVQRLLDGNCSAS